MFKGLIAQLIKLGGTLVVSVVVHLLVFSAGWTKDGSVIWAISNGLAIWTVFTLVSAALRIVLGDGGPYLLFIAGGLVYLVALKVTFTISPLAIGWFWLLAIPHAWMATINTEPPPHRPKPI